MDRPRTPDPGSCRMGIGMAASVAPSAALELTATERAHYAEEGFFVRERVFSAADLARFREAAERVVAHTTKAAEVSGMKAAQVARAAAPRSDDYRIDGNRYVEVAESTVQFEHAADSQTIRVIEPFHHLDPVFDRLVE